MRKIIGFIFRISLFFICTALRLGKVLYLQLELMWCRKAGHSVCFSVTYSMILQLEMGDAGSRWFNYTLTCKCCTVPRPCPKHSGGRQVNCTMTA